MEITTDVVLKGSNWRKALEAFAVFFPQSLQPNYSLYAISMAIGIMYDKQLDIAGEENDLEKENRLYVPRTVLHPHNTDLDFLFQTAILTSKLVDFTNEQRMDLAFNPSCDILFNKFDFLTKFANFGIGRLFQEASDDPIETMENVKKFIASSVEGYNYDINAISDEDLNIEDLQDDEN